LRPVAKPAVCISKIGTGIENVGALLGILILTQEVVE
jgi:hypothetical protein